MYLFESTRRRRTSGGRSTATTGAERRHSNRSSAAGLEHRKKSHPSDVFLCISLRARDVAERPGDVRLRRPEWNADIRTVRARQGLNIEKRAIHRMTLFSISLRARDGIRTLPISGKLLKSRRNAHCLPCVYRLSTTWKSERKAVKGSAEQIHFTPLLLVIEVDNVSKL